jgi:hypothetical protein
MARSRPARSRSRRRRGLTRRQRRRLVRTAGVLVGTAIAAAGGWLFAAGRPSAPPAPVPVTAAAGPPVVPLELRLTPGATDPRVAGDRLEVPVVDFAELLPSCHN